MLAPLITMLDKAGKCAKEECTIRLHGSIVLQQQVEVNGHNKGEVKLSRIHRGGEVKTATEPAEGATPAQHQPGRCSERV